jgi:hypothetical protein
MQRADSPQTTPSTRAVVRAPLANTEGQMPRLKIIPLGGLSEIGKNLTV